MKRFLPIIIALFLVSFFFCTTPPKSSAAPTSTPEIDVEPVYEPLLEDKSEQNPAYISVYAQIPVNLILNNCGSAGTPATGKFFWTGTGQGSESGNSGDLSTTNGTVSFPRSDGFTAGYYQIKAFCNNVEVFYPPQVRSAPINLAAIGFHTEPSPGIANSPINLVTTGCRPHSQVTFDYGTRTNKYTDDTGVATLSLPRGLAQGFYAVAVECNGQRKHGYRITINAATAPTLPANAPHLSTQPASPFITGDTTTKLIITNCPASARATLKIDNNNDVFGAYEKPVDIPSGGIGEYKRTEGWTEGEYTVWISCGNFSNVPFDNAFEVRNRDQNELTVSVNPETPFKNDRNTEFSVTGCTPGSNAKAHFTVSKPILLGGHIDVIYVYEPINGQGRAFHKQGLDGPSDYTLTVTCNGATKSMGFNVLEEMNIPTPLPDAPSPVCDQFDQAGTGKCIRVNTLIGKINTDGKGLILSIFYIVLSLSGGIALIVIIYAGYIILTSRGNPEQVKKGREMLTSAIIGILFIIFSFTILEVITDNVLHIPGFKQSPYTCPLPGGVGC